MKPFITPNNTVILRKKLSSHSNDYSYFYFVAREEYKINPEYTISNDEWFSKHSYSINFCSINASYISNSECIANREKSKLCAKDFFNSINGYYIVITKFKNSQKINIRNNDGLDALDFIINPKNMGIGSITPRVEEPPFLRLMINILTHRVSSVLKQPLFPLLFFFYSNIYSMINNYCTP